MPALRLLRRALAALAAAACTLAQAGEITVSAAVSLSNALRDVAPLFEAAHPGAKLQFNFGASGGLLAQISKGAPVDVFASADQEAMDQAARQGLVKARRDLVGNALVVVVPASAAATPKTLAEVAALPRIAIGLPGSVPAGRYARGALQQAGLWAAVEPKAVGATTVRQALDYVARAEVDAGFVYATDAALLPARVRVAFTVPTAVPVRYPVALLAGAPNAAQAQRFFDFLFTPPAQAVFARHGFTPP